MSFDHDPCLCLNLSEMNFYVFSGIGQDNFSNVMTQELPLLLFHKVIGSSHCGSGGDKPD